VESSTGRTGTFNFDEQTLTASEGETAAESTESEVPDIISFQTTANLLDRTQHQRRRINAITASYCRHLPLFCTDGKSYFPFQLYDHEMANKIKCSHILVQKQSEALAILERLKKGESFSNLAKELSIDKGSGKRGGDLGYFGRGMMVKPFEEAAFKLEKGQTSEPVRTEFGYHIIKRLD
jgi:peptidyl-prolyl cis-trans isomerase C